MFEPIDMKASKKTGRFLKFKDTFKKLAETGCIKSYD